MKTKFSCILMIALLWGCGGGGKTKPDFVVTDEGDAIEEATEEVDITPDKLPDGKQEMIEEMGEDIGTIEAVEIEEVVKCLKDEDCNDAPLTVGECQKKICVKKSGVCGVDWDDTCCLTKVFMDQGFEIGIPKDWKVYDDNPEDKVAWNVLDGEGKVGFGKYSLYFGDPKCLTYYNGPLGDDCKPTDPNMAESKRVTAYVETPFFEIPPVASTFVLSFYLWMQTEYKTELPDELQTDQLRVDAYVEGEEKPKNIFLSSKVKNNTNGNFIHISIGLSSFVGKKVAVRFTFDTMDEKDNFYEGFYIDNIRIEGMCNLKLCQLGDTCPSDGKECTDDNCEQIYGEAQGYCPYAEIVGCGIEPECTPENVLEKCKTSDPCKIPKCVDKKCAWDIDPDCCKTTEILTANFDDGSLQGFVVQAYKPGAKVKWWVDDNRSTSGKYSLYYGDKVQHTYVGDGDPNFGDATSGAFDLPEKGYAFLTFQLLLSTEFDDTIPEKYSNIMGQDLFEVFIVEKVQEGSSWKEKETLVWSSHQIYGTTCTGDCLTPNDLKFIPVGVDLTPFMGKKDIRLRFRFKTLDEIKNDYEGVYIDDIKIVHDPCLHKNCMGKYDCWIDGVCKVGDCEENVCDVTVITAPPKCCSNNLECDDANDCTMDGCLDHKCVNAFFETPMCCKPEEPIIWDFDSTGNMDGFTVETDGTDTKWQSSTLESHSPDKALYFGNGTNYDNDGIAKGSATSPEFFVYQYGIVKVSMWVYLDVEVDPTKDKLTVEIISSAEQTTLFTKDDINPNDYKKWVKIGPFDVSSKHKGLKAKLKISFDSVDQVENTGLGVFVDDIMIEKVCPK